MRNTGATNSKPETGHVPASRAPTWARRTASVMIAAYGLASALLPLTQAWAQAPIADPRAPIAFQPSIQQQPGGGALVNITTPNSAGLSLNQYQRFDVPQSGVVLNNSLVGGNPLLGGQASANPNLSGGRAATTIVNEVTAAGPAGQLRGSIEVFGNPAAVIVANPNGITCDGCGVVNTPRFTLSTGRVQLNDPLGNPSDFLLASQPGFDVAGGSIGIEGQGVEGTVGRLDLIGQSLRVDAPLRAHYLNQDISSINLVAGAARQVTPAFAAPQQPGGNRSGIAIDATALGAMTAGRISIIATEEGMGVRLAGPLLAYQEDIRIQSAGRIDAAGLAAARDIRLDSNGFITLAGETSAHGTLQANARQGMQISGTTQARSDIRLDSSQGGIQVRGDLLTGGSLGVHAAGNVIIGQAGSTTQAAGDVILAGQSVQQYGSLDVGRDLNASAVADVALTGDARIGRDAYIRGGGSVLLLGHLQVNGNAAASARDIVASGQNTVSGNFTLDGRSSVQLGGSTLVGGTLAVQGASVGISGSISAGSTEVDAGELSLGQNGGNLDIGGDLGLNVRGPLHVKGTVSVSGSAGISTGGDATFDGAMNIGRDLGLHAGGDLSVNAPITAGGSISASAGRDILVTGQVNSAGSQQWHAGRDLTAQQGIEASGLTASGRNIDIAGPVLLAGPARISAGEQLRLGSELRANGSVTATAGSGGVQAQDILANEDLIVHSEGGIAMLQAQAQRDVSLGSSQGSIQVQALLAGRDATIGTIGQASIDGVLHAGRHLTVTIQGGPLTLHETVWAGGNADLSAKSISLAQGLQAGGSLRLQATQGGVASAESIIANGDLAIWSQGGIDIQGDAASGGALRLESTQATRIGGDVAAQGALEITSGAQLQAQRLLSGGDLDVTAASTDTHAIQAQGSAQIRVQDSVNVQGGILASRIGIKALNGSIVATEDVATPGALDLRAGSGIAAGNVVGGTGSGESTRLHAQGGDIDVGSLQAGGQYQASAGGSHIVRQELIVQGTADIEAGGDIRTGADAAFGNGLRARAGGDLHVQGDTLVLGDASMQTGDAQTYGGSLRATGRLDADAGNGIATAGELRVNDGLALQAGTGGIDIGGHLATLGDAQLSAERDIRIQGSAEFAGANMRSTQGGIGIGGGMQAQTGTTLQARQDIHIAGPTLAQAGLDARSSAGSITFGGDLDAAGDLIAHAAQDLQFQGDSLLLGHTSLRADNGRIHNQGEMTFAQPVAIDTTGDLVNEGLIQSQGGIDIRARNIHSNLASSGGIVTAGDISLQASASMRQGQQGTFSAGGDMTLEAAGGLTSQGTIQAGGALGYSGGTLSNSGQIAAQDITVAASLANQGQITAQNGLQVTGSTSNGGQIAATAIDMASVVNSGQIGAQAITLGATSNGGEIAGNTIGIGGGLDNTGVISASATLSASGGSIANDGAIVGGSVSLSGSSVVNGGQIQSGGQLTISAGSFDNRLSETRRCIATGGCAADAPQESWQYMQDPGSVHAGGPLSINVGSMSNQGVISAGGDIDIQASAGMSNTRSVNDPYTSVGGSGGVSTGIISAGGSLSIAGASIANAGGQIQAGGAIDIRTGGAFSNSAPASGVTGRIAGSSVTVSAGSIANQGLLLATAGDLQLDAGGGAVSNAQGASMLGANVQVQGGSFSNAGNVYGQAGPAARIDIQTSGSFSNAASGIVIAGSQLDIAAGGYGNTGGTVGSLGDVTYTSTNSYSPISNPLLALGHLQLNVAGVSVGANESWIYGGPSIGWTGTFTNAGSVAIVGSAKGNIHNVYTGGVFRFGVPDTGNGTYLVPYYPAELAGLTDVHVVGYTDVARRAQLYIGGDYMGSLVNEGSDAAVGGGSIEQRNVDQTITWEGKNADGDVVTVTGDSRTLARLYTGSGGATITLTGPDTGTIVGNGLVINGGNLTIQPGIDPTTGLLLVHNAQGRQVNAGSVDPAGVAQTAQGDVQTGTIPAISKPLALEARGQDPGAIGAGHVGGAGGAGGSAGGGARTLNLSPVDVGTPQGGVAALLGGGQSVAWPDWSQMRIVPGGISANDLQLNLNGQFTNRGELSVTNNLVINVAEGIDNFGASIRAGGYTSLSGASLDNRGGQIEAGSLLAAVEGGIDNSRGSITASNGGYLQAGGNITASEGRFASEAGQFVLDAGGNIDLAASTVQGRKGVGLYAEGDIRLGAIAKTEHSETRQDNIVTLYAPGGNEGELGIAYEAKLGEIHRKQDSTTHSGTTIDAGEGSATVRAKGDVAVIGSDIKAGKDVLVQGASVRIESVIDKNTTYEAEHRKNYDHVLATHAETLKGGEITAGGNLSVIANGATGQDKGDIALKGATISAQGQASLIASRDVLLQDQQTQHSRYEETYTKKSGFLSKKSTHTIEQGEASLSESSLVTGEQVYVQAGRDIGLTGSHVIGQEAAALVVGRDITLQAGQDSASAESYSQTKKSGLFSGGGLSLTLGSRSVTTEHENTSVRAAGSSVQAQGGKEGENKAGNVTIVAGGQYQQTGSAVLGAGDVDIVAKSVEIREARELEKDRFEMRVKQSGLTVSVSSPVISAAQTASSLGNAIGKTSDTRTQAIGLAAGGLYAYNHGDKVREDMAQLADGKPPTSIGINISVGSSQSSSTSAYQRDSAVGSVIHGDGNVNIIATEGDVKVRGSTVQATHDVGLYAQKGNVTLEAAQNHFAEQNSHSSSSASLGVGFNVGAGSAGFDVNASYSQSKGRGDGASLTNSNTHVRAGGNASIQSGQDTTLKGAVITADTVKADVGGNLTIESLQDTSRYNETSRSSGASVSVPIGAGTPGASISSGRTQINSDYRSVGEQSAIHAGDGGFQVEVKGDTTLKGGAITSTQEAGDNNRNRFSTGGQLAMSDIENHAAYSASGSQVTLGMGSAKGNTSVGVGHDSGNASSTSRAGISGIAGSENARTGDAETGLKPIFDKNRARNNVDAGITVATEFNRQGKLAVNNYADGKKRPYEEARANLQEVEKQLKNSVLDADERVELERQKADYQQIMSDTKQDYDNWRDGGPNKIMADIFVAMVSGGPTAAEGTAVAGAGKWVTNSMRESMIAQSEKYPGICDTAGRCVSNISGDSVGVDRDGRKIGGGRLNIGEICKEYVCKINPVNGMVVVVEDEHGNAGNIRQIVDENPKFRSPLGGSQGGQGKLPIVGNYSSGDWQDYLVESFAGPHDFLNAWYWYGSDGNIKPGMNDRMQQLGEILNAINVPLAAPLALPNLVPIDLLSIIFGSVR